MTGGEPDPKTIGLSTYELMALVLLFREKKQFCESEIREHIFTLSQTARNGRVSSKRRIGQSVSSFLQTKVLRWDHDSALFIYNRCNDKYLRIRLGGVITDRQTEEKLRELVMLTTPNPMRSFKKQRHFGGSTMTFVEAKTVVGNILRPLGLDGGALQRDAANAIYKGQTWHGVAEKWRIMVADGTISVVPVNPKEFS